MDDEKIINLFVLRDEAAIVEAKRKYGARLYRTAMNFLHNHADAEECVSDALLRAWDAIPPTHPAKLGAFLAKIVRNLALNRIEARRAAKRGGGETDVMLSELEDCLPDTNSKPEDVYERSQVTIALNTFLEAQDQAVRATFVLRYFHGESILAIAGRFNMSESKVKSMLFRTRKKLHTFLEKEGICI